MEEKLYIENEKGEKLECDILFTFESKDKNNNYIIYTDNSLDELGNKRVYANTYNPNNPSGTLGKIKTEEEWAIIEQIMNSINNK